MHKKHYGLALTSLVFGGGLTVPLGAAHAQYVGHVSSFVMDANSGAVLSQSDPDLQRYPASLTKVMTLYLAFKALRAGQITLDTPVPVSIHASTMAPSKLGLVPGTSFNVQQAIFGLVTKSANDAACALGELLGGGDEVRFANMMTQQARALGMSNTTFRNASGLPDPEQVTTARDLGTLTQHMVQEFPEYYHYFSTPMFYFHGRMIPNHNPMLKTYAGADGLKTGYTDLAGHNLITSAMRSNVRLIAVVMGTRSNMQRNNAMTAMLNKAFADEGVAPVAPLSPPVVLARNTRSFRHAHRFAMPSSQLLASQSMEVAEAPTGPRRYAPIHRVHRHVVTTASVRMASIRRVGGAHKRPLHRKG
ncbi:D-alanyl-D-alanine carboxypeptidase family protein [Kozakia baliensis]|uniref:D-alanyl-D-alanine carboxypeptidase family protein n=1 Tax=Kozakia baliensis TaxID=153496 RepID=UPI000B14FF0D|nr:D-alanyl-D-alanine serine-type carboxypeptidase [Kozakia baliensis NRIC 0488]GEL63763.1 hypothetical protein KBA01_10490 [Kozakia baliensis]